MSHLLSRIMLALFMLPLAAMIYTFTIVILGEFVFSYSNGEYAFLITDFVTAGFVVVYWSLLWKQSVQWSSRRIGLSIAAGAGSIIAGGALGIIVSFVDDSFAVFFGGISAILLWLVATCLIWRETREERASRLRGTSSQTIACPICGYNLTGLRTTMCPECGTTFTIDELLTAQPTMEASELDSESPANTGDESDATRSTTSDSGPDSGLAKSAENTS